jgi:uncharacterized membrane protein YqaE (UPF0057 family)
MIINNHDEEIQNIKSENEEIQNIKSDNNNDIIETFGLSGDTGSVIRSKTEDSYGISKIEDIDAGSDGNLSTFQFACLKKKRNALKKKKNDYREWASNSMEENKTKTAGSFSPEEGETDSNFGTLNLIYFIIPLFNLVIEILLDLYSIFFWFVKLVFDETAKMIIPNIADLLGSATGLRAGKKYCFTFKIFRHLSLILCPPAGVFMAYGLKGWFQILICCIGSLLYYFPGLAYALIVINRSDVADRMKMKNEPSACNDGGFGESYFMSDEDNQPKCSVNVGEKCSLVPKPVHGDPMKLDCCANPVLGEDGQWTRNGKPATDREGRPITSFEQGELMCRNDTKVIKSKFGLCVWKQNKKPN